MQKLIDTLISNNLELIESGNLKSIVLDSGVFITFESTEGGITTTVKSKSENEYNKI